MKHFQQNTPRNSARLTIRSRGTSTQASPVRPPLSSNVRPLQYSMQMSPALPVLRRPVMRLVLRALVRGNDLVAQPGNMYKVVWIARQSGRLVVRRMFTRCSASWSCVGSACSAQSLAVHGRSLLGCSPKLAFNLGADTSHRFGSALWASVN